MILIKNIEVYSPEPIGKKDVLVSGSKIFKIADSIDFNFQFCKVIDGSDKKLVPGFIDSHVHICGGGGESGFKTRTPEVMLSSIVMGGITTVVGVLGTDGTTRTMSNLIAKTKGLKEEGISAYCLTGSYEVPTRTITGSVTDDIILIEEIIGSGELAISDHRSSAPSLDAFRTIVAESRRGGVLSGKAGVVNVHLGDHIDGLKLISEVVASSMIPIKQFLPTHMNRNPELFKQGIDHVRNGGYVDFTTSTVPEFLADGEVECCQALDTILRETGKSSNVTFSSDGQGSLPQYDSEGNMIRLKIGTCMSLYPAVRDAIVKKGIPLGIAIKVITSNPADILKLNKGYIEENRDADLVILDQDLNIDTVIAMGKIFVEEKVQLVKGTFE